MKRVVEILAPGGSVDSIKAAVAAGADAIYTGGTMFGARAYANNLSEEELAILDILTKPEPKLSKKEFETVKIAAQKLVQVIKKEKLVLLSCTRMVSNEDEENE